MKCQTFNVLRTKINQFMAKKLSTCQGLLYVQASLRNVQELYPTTAKYFGYELPISRIS